MAQRPVTTLFLLESVDGKISPGETDVLDVDRDFPKLDGLKQGLQQYYEIEQTTDLWSMNSGRVQAKLGVNSKEFPDKSPVSFVIIDNHHLDCHGVEYLARLSKTFVLVTSNPNHPGFQVKQENLHILYQEEFSPQETLGTLYAKFGCERITIQTGGTLNGLFLREKLLDYVDIVIAPVLIGGRNTATLVDGASLQSPEELDRLGVLRLERCDVLEDSYLRLRYKVIS